MPLVVVLACVCGGKGEVQWGPHNKSSSKYYILCTIIGNQNFEISTLSEHFESEGVTVILELDSLSLYSYYVSAVPQLTSLISIGSTVVLIKVSFNVHYNVSILAASPCGRNNFMKFFEVYYGALSL